ncbi:MAG: AMP-binding protein [Acidimicrobiia bacterium]|nr:AMP-binding protein [Acidimicrobiia bacterium]
MSDDRRQPERTEVDSLTAMALAQPDKAAVIDDRPGEVPRILTYAEFNHYVNRIANGLRAMGVVPDEKVMWLGRNSIEVTGFAHAARKLGAVSVPLNYRLTDDESVYVINNSDSTVIFADSAHAEMLERIRPRLEKVREVVVFASGSALNGDGRPIGIRPGQNAEIDVLGSATEPPPAAAPGRVMIYTSGTTGSPKGAVRHPTGGAGQVTGLLALLGYRPDDIYLTCGPLYHSGPGGFATIAFAMGHTVVIQHTFNPEDWLRLVDKYRCSSSFSAPTPIRMIVHLPGEVKARYDVSAMRVMVANAAPWPFSLKEAYVKMFPPESLWEVYGSTEMGVNTVLAPADQLRKPGSCGLPAPEVEVALFDDDRNLITEANVPGELFVRSSSMFDTYYKAHDRYEADDHDGWHTVGDIAYRDTEGYFFICDRKRDMIISGGMNIYPAEVEAALERHPGVYEAAVIGVPSEKWGEAALAVVVAEDGVTLTTEELDQHSRRHLAGYKLPRRFEFVDVIPKTGSNKILKRELRERFATVRL